LRDRNKEELSMTDAAEKTVNAAHSEASLASSG
jgi:hypothetical protein